MDVGNVTSATVQIGAGQTYYFVVQAYNTAGQLSTYSAEVPFPVSTPPAHGTAAADVDRSLARERASGNGGHDHWHELRRDAGHKRGDIQRDSQRHPRRGPRRPSASPVPAGATTGNVVVTVGGQVSNALPFAVTPAPANTTITATWNANPETNIAGYKLSYGSSSGSYTSTMDVGNVTNAVVQIVVGQTYYFAVQAYNTAGRLSPFSTEVPFPLATPPPVPPPTPTLTSLSLASGLHGHFGHPHRDQLWRCAGRQHSDVQRDSRHAGDMVFHDHRGARAGRGDDRQCPGYRRRGGKQRAAVHRHRTGPAADTHPDRSFAGEWTSRNADHDRGHELWLDAGRQHRHVQRHPRDADGVVRDDHRRAGAGRCGQRQCRRHRRRRAEQCAALQRHRASATVTNTDRALASERPARYDRHDRRYRISARLRAATR